MRNLDDRGEKTGGWGSLSWPLTSLPVDPLCQKVSENALIFQFYDAILHAMQNAYMPNFENNRKQKETEDLIEFNKAFLQSKS